MPEQHSLIPRRTSVSIVMGGAGAGLLVAISVISLFLFAKPTPLFSETFHVDRFDDANGSCEPGDCSLREALLAAEAMPGRDRVMMPPGIHTLSIKPDVVGDLSQGSLDIVRHGVEIIADSGAVIDAQGIGRVFRFVLGTSRLVNLTITGGDVNGLGGGVYVESSDLDLENVWIVGNRSELGGGLAIGLGTVKLYRSTISGNESLTSGGGAYVSGISQSVIGRLELYNSTISGNHAAQLGGAIFIGARGQLLLQHSTVAQNTNRPGDLTIVPFLPHLPAEARFSAVEGSCGEGPDSSCIFLASKAEELPAEDLLLAPLASNGFRAPSHALAADSPVIDVAAATASCPAIDQRGAHRPVDGDGDGDALCDAGAFEFEGLSTVEVPVLDTKALFVLMLFLSTAGVVALRR